MIPVGQPYRPAGTLDARSILITTILGVTAAVIGAAVVWLWEWSPIPTLVVITPIVQGAGVGAVMAFAVGRLRMRNPRLVATVGFACGLLSIVLVHYGHYIRMVTAAAGECGRVAQDKAMPEGERQAILAQLDADPAAFIDPMLVRKTGHSGFLGSLVLRNQQGIWSRATVTGTFLWILWGVEALIVAVMAAVSPGASQPAVLRGMRLLVREAARPVHPAGAVGRAAGRGRPGGQPLAGRRAARQPAALRQVRPRRRDAPRLPRLRPELRRRLAPARPRGRRRRSRSC